MLSRREDNSNDASTHNEVFSAIESTIASDQTHQMIIHHQKALNIQTLRESEDLCIPKYHNKKWLSSHVQFIGVLSIEYRFRQKQ